MAKQSKINALSIPFTAVIDLIGRNTLAVFIYIAQLSYFIWRVLSSIQFKKLKSTRQALNSQIIFSGIDALPTITILSFALAFSVTSQLLVLLQSLTSEKEAIQLLSKIIAQELAPLLTAVILIGRSSSAITIDLGNMKVRNEIKALELLGINIYTYFALPRMLGIIFSQFVLSIYFACIVMIGGIIFASLIDSPSNYKYLYILASSITPIELGIFIVKSLLFGLIIGSTACYHGLNVNHSITEVPQQTQRSIVNSLILIFTIDGLLVAL